MIITVECPSCNTTFPVDPRKVPAGGVKVRCSACSGIFFVDEPRPVPPPPAVPLPAERPPQAEVPVDEDRAHVDPWSGSGFDHHEAMGDAGHAEGPADPWSGGVGLDESAPSGAAAEAPEAEEAFEAADAPEAEEVPEASVDEPESHDDGDWMFEQRREVDFREPEGGVERMETVEEQVRAAAAEMTDESESDVAAENPWDAATVPPAAEAPVEAPDAVWHDGAAEVENREDVEEHAEAPAADEPHDAGWDEAGEAPETASVVVDDPWGAAHDAGDAGAPEDESVAAEAAEDGGWEDPTAEEEAAEWEEPAAEEEADDDAWRDEPAAEEEADDDAWRDEPAASEWDGEVREEEASDAQVEAAWEEAAAEAEVVEPEPAPPAGFQFGKRDPHEKARRLARVLVSDMITYNPDRHRRALEQGTLHADFEEEIRKSWAEYTDQVGRDLAESTTYWFDALNEILARGEKVF